MVYRKISVDLQECALRLWELGWTEADICETLEISRASLYRWRALFRSFGNTSRPPSPLRGRPRIISRAVLSAIQLLLLSHPDTYLDELVWWLAVKHDIAISRSALQANLSQAGLTHKLLQKIAAERNEELRAEWKEMVAAEFLGTGDEFIFVDETSKNDLTYGRRFGYAPAGARAELSDVFVRGQRYSLAAAMSKEGYIATRIVEGSFDSIEFYNFIVEDVLPQMNPWPHARSTLVVDNCSIHHNQALVDVVHNAGCLILYLPSYSPDFNPIENSFSKLKCHIRRHGAEIRVAPDPVAALYEACGCITGEMAEGWFAHAGYIKPEYRER
ncbi:hypothetical protein VTO73DRAFT_6567 [Trametes versicolor]